MGLIGWLMVVAAALGACAGVVSFIRVGSGRLAGLFRADDRIPLLPVEGGAASPRRAGVARPAGTRGGAVGIAPSAAAMSKIVLAAKCAWAAVAGALLGVLAVLFVVALPIAIVTNHQTRAFERGIDVGQSADSVRDTLGDPDYEGVEPPATPVWAWRKGNQLEYVFFAPNERLEPTTVSAKSVQWCYEHQPALRDTHGDVPIDLSC
jgi:hypothetical protein